MRSRLRKLCRLVPPRISNITKAAVRRLKNGSVRKTAGRTLAVPVGLFGSMIVASELLEEAEGYRQAAVDYKTHNSRLRELRLAEAKYVAAIEALERAWLANKSGNTSSSSASGSDCKWQEQLSLNEWYPQQTQSSTPILPDQGSPEGVQMVAALRALAEVLEMRAASTAKVAAVPPPTTRYRSASPNTTTAASTVNDWRTTTDRKLIGVHLRLLATLRATSGLDSLKTLYECRELAWLYFRQTPRRTKDAIGISTLALQLASNRRSREFRQRAVAWGGAGGIRPVDIDRSSTSGRITRSDAVYLEMQAAICEDLSTFYRRCGQFVQAKTHAKQALSLLDELGLADSKRAGILWTGVTSDLAALCTTSHELLPAAKEAVRVANAHMGSRKSHSRSSLAPWQCVAHSNLISVYLEQNDMDSTMEHLERFDQRCPKMKDDIVDALEQGGDDDTGKPGLVYKHIKCEQFKTTGA